MGKNQRNKKRLREEKAKVHIKSKTKFLPKGQNITNTAFKIKPIVIQEQLKEREKDGLLSKKKYSVNELLTKLKHFNDNIKVEACQDLKEMIKNHTMEIVQTYISQIIQNASTLIQDREKKVRRACINLFNEIFANVASIKLEAFSNYILINLKCAMTNIDKNIQEDSLLLLDALLEHQPQLVANHFEKIFVDFLTLISKLRNQGAPDRTLTLNLGSKMTSVKWRIKVLSRLYDILNILIETSHGRKSEKKNNAGIYEVKPIVHKASGACFIPLFKDPKNYERCAVNYFYKNTVKTEQSPSIHRHITILVPLLYETWIETLPEQSLKKNLSDMTVLSGESAAIFCCVVNILRLLYEYFQLNNIEGIFTSSANVKFLERLVTSIPYSQNKSKKSEISKEITKLLMLSHDQHCVEENLMIIFLVVTFKANFTPDLLKQKMPNIGFYLNKCLTSHNYLNSKNMKYFVKIIKDLFQNSTFWYRRGVSSVEIMNNLINFYDEGRVPDDFKNDVLEILTSSFPYKYEKQQEWLEKLPQSLCKDEVSAKLINIILELCKQNHRSIQDEVRKNLKPILANLPITKITDTENKGATELSIVYIFFYIPTLTENELNIIDDFIQTHENTNYAAYFKEMLNFKLHVLK